MKESLLAEWDYEKNGTINPKTVTDYSNKKFYWLCPNGHPSYLMSVNKRTTGQGCPVCSNHKIISGINDFATTNPELMTEWCWEMNSREGIDPTTFSYGTNRKVWWKCKTCGNTWSASVSNRASRNSGCPYCSNYKVKKGFNDLATVSPDIAKEWDYEKNSPLKPDEVVAFYSKKVWWRCKDCGNSWQASPNARARRGCPYCCNHIKIEGFNDFESQYPGLVKEWDYDKNKKLPSQYAAGSDARVWWKCSNGHSWKTTINSRTKRSGGCPYCSNKKVLLGYNDLFTTNPELKEEWDFEKNKNVSPSTIGAGYQKKVWWICKSCGNSWETRVYLRVNGSGCPECGKEKNKINRLKTMASKNPLFLQYPYLEEEWDYEKNKSLDISLIPASSSQFVWWKCKEGHSYKTRISTRTLRKAGCPYCHGQKVLPGINDLKTLNPNLAEEWDYEKNKPLTPSDVFSHGSKTVWWKCSKCGYSWKAKINNRANGRGCPACKSHGTSFIEQVIYYYVKKLYDDTENRYLYNGVELDIYIPRLKIAIEYDGAYFHSIAGSTQREEKKDTFCAENDICLVRLREKPLKPTSKAINIPCDCSTWGKIERTCMDLIHFLDPKVNPSISIPRDYLEITSYIPQTKGDYYYQYFMF